MREHHTVLADLIQSFRGASVHRDISEVPIVDKFAHLKNVKPSSHKEPNGDVRMDGEQWGLGFQFMVVSPVDLDEGFWTYLASSRTMAGDSSGTPGKSIRPSETVESEYRLTTLAAPEASPRKMPSCFQNKYPVCSFNTATLSGEHIVV